MTVPTLVLLALLAPMVAVSLTNLMTAPRLHRVPPDRRGPRVSVLVPARDEAENVGGLLAALLASDYEPLEICVLDDGSADGTADQVRDFAARDPRIRLVEGTEPPPGWTGKNWACQRLADLATGDVLVFCDADVRPSSQAVGRTVAALGRTGANALTAIPRHEKGGLYEQAVIPLVATVPIAVLLPLTLVRRTRTASLSVGNGQWFAWRRDAYARVGGHARVRSDVLEDVRLARVAKREGLRLAAFVATGDLSVRMYRGRGATREGFIKNLYPLAGGRKRTLALGVLLLLTAGLGPILLPLAGGGAVAGPTGLLPLAELLVVRLASAALMAESATAVLLHPAGVLAVAVLAVQSWLRHRGGTVTWKGRVVHHEEVL